MTGNGFREMIGFDIVYATELYCMVMTATAHGLAAGMIAAALKDPVIGVSLSFISHPLLDMVPHWDAGLGWRQKTKKKLFVQASADVLLGFGLGYVVYALFGGGANFWYFLACFVAAESLDLMQIPYWFLGWNFAPFSWVYKFQHQIQGRARLPWGIVTQVAALGLVFLILQVYKF